MIFEENVENEDFFEIILSPKEYENIVDKGQVSEFKGGLYGKRNLNVYIRIDKNME